jgi:hypothetical protein
MTARTQNCDNASKNFAEEPDDRTSFGMAGIGTFLPCQLRRAMSAFWGTAVEKCSL